MPVRNIFILLLFSSTAAWGRVGTAAAPALSLQAPTTLPIVFTSAIGADRSRSGDPVSARTSQVVHLADGSIIPAGSNVSGHVVAVTPFVYDHTPYAHQKQGVLTVQFDSVQVQGATLPLRVTVRAMATPIASWGAREPESSDLDPLGTMTQIGGDRFTPSQSHVVSSDGDVVAYNKRRGIYAHLIPNGDCDGSDVEVSVGIYSASACGLYGFANVSAQQMGSSADPSVLTLVSTRMSPKIWKHSTALLEVLPPSQTVASR